MAPLDQVDHFITTPYYRPPFSAAAAGEHPRRPRGPVDYPGFQVCMVFNMPHVPEGNSVIDVSVVCPKDEEGYPPDEEGGLNIYQAPPRAHANSEGMQNGWNR